MCTATFCPSAARSKVAALPYEYERGVSLGLVDLEGVEDVGALGFVSGPEDGLDIVLRDHYVVERGHDRDLVGESSELGEVGVE